MQNNKRTISHAKSFLKSDIHFSSACAAEAKEISKQLDLKNAQSIEKAIQFLKKGVPDIHFTSKGAKAEAIDISIKLSLLED